MHRILWHRFLRRWFSSAPARGEQTQSARLRAPRLRAPRLRPRLEELEDRTLLAATTYVVNLAGDAGTSTGANSGDIRYCIDQADNPANAGSTITFSATIGSTILLTHGELKITDNMTIQGPGSSGLTIDGGFRPPTPGNIFGQAGSRIFNISNSAATVTISGLTITSGNASPTDSTTPGNQGGDIFNAGKLTLLNDVISTGNSLGVVGGPPGRGGGIFNAAGSSGPGSGASLTLSNTTVTGNIAQGSGNLTQGGLGAGGGIYNDTNATLIITGGSQISNNQALGSTGIDGQNGPSGLPGTPGVNAPNRTVPGTAGGPGGRGTDGQNAGPGGDGEGGGVYNAGSVTFSGVAFADNSALGGRGGNGGAGGNGGNGGIGGNGGSASGGNAGSAGGRGGRGGDGGIGGLGADAGAGLGGGLFNAGTVTGISQVRFLGNLAQGGVGGAGGAGGAGGTGGAGGAGGASTKSGASGPGGRGGNGGSGGNAGNAANGGAAQGGGLYTNSGSLNISSSQFTVDALGVGNKAISGDAGTGGNGGAGGGFGAGGSGSPAGANGIPGILGSGGNAGNVEIAAGGALASAAGNLSISATTFIASLAQTGLAALAGGGLPPGLDGSSNIASGGALSITSGDLVVSACTFGGNTFGLGNKAIGGDAGVFTQAGMAFGGAIDATGNVGNVTISSSTISHNMAISGIGDNEEADGGGVSYRIPSGSTNTTAHLLAIASTSFTNNEGIATSSSGLGTVTRVQGGGLFVSNLTSAMTVTASTSSFSNNGVLSGFDAAGGAISVEGTAAAPGSLSLNNTPISNNQVLGGAVLLIPRTNGFGTNPVASNQALVGLSGSERGGGIDAFDYSLSLASSPVSLNVAGGGIDDADGGGIAANADATTPVGYSLDTSDVTSNQLSQSAGGFATTGTIPGGVHGAGVYFVNGNTTITNSNLDGNSAIAPGGGLGATGSRGGNGGAALGGGLFFNNTLGTTLTFAFSGGSASSNQLMAGNGGGGGDAPAIGSKYITGGSGGDGGEALGGGIFLQADANSANTVSISNATLAGNVLTSGSGGAGGQGSSSTGTTTPGPFSGGGKGGLTAGGGIYNNSLNTTLASTLSLSGSTLASNHLTSGAGGRGGTGTTPNGGPGGNGGSGGDALGGGLYDGDNTGLTVINSTFGGPSANPAIPTANSNILAGGLGGAGGDAGTPNLVPFNDGGNGGSGGSVKGGGVYVNSSNANIINATIVANQALSSAFGGAPGAGAGGGAGGLAGANGISLGGGYFAGGGTNSVGNTILGLNAATTGPDASGTFISLGHNILTSSTGFTGFGNLTHDQTGVTAAQLDLGALAANGGPTLTVGLGATSVAIDTGDNTLIKSPPFSNPATDQRGPGFMRIFNGTVDVGAFELQGSPSPPLPPPGPPPSPPPGPPPVPPPPIGPPVAPVNGAGFGTTTTIVAIQNSYPGLIQVETVTAKVFNPAGIPINQGFVTFQVNGQSITAPVVNGEVTVTFATSLLDFSILFNLFFAHPLSANFNDNARFFAPSGSAVPVPGLLVDFVFSLLAQELALLTQFQVL